MNPSLSPLKIFIVEDSMLVRARLAAYLEPIGAAQIVGEAEDVEMAIEGIEASHAEAVIVDLRLTGGHGLELLRMLAKNTRRIISIVLTNYTSPAFREASLAAGADYFFDKTTEFDEAMHTITSLAKHKKVNEAVQ